MDVKSVKINGKSYLVSYVVAQKRTSSVRIRNGEVLLRLSRHLRGEDRDRAVEKFLKWASGKLAGASGSFVCPKYKDKGRVSLHNKIYEISVSCEERRSSRVRLLGGYLIEILLPLSMSFDEYEKKVRYLVEKVIMKDQKPYLEEVLDELNQLYFQVLVSKCQFKRMNSRFGSCTRKGSISIAYNMLFMPREVFRYVCVHELAHLKEFNHSKKFWEVVSAAMPEYKEHERWLRRNGYVLG